MDSPQPLVIKLSLEQQFRQATLEGQIDTLQPKDFDALKQMFKDLHYQNLMKDAIIRQLMAGGF